MKFKSLTNRIITNPPPKNTKLELRNVYHILVPWQYPAIDRSVAEEEVSVMGFDVAAWHAARFCVKCEKLELGKRS